MTLAELFFRGRCNDFPRNQNPSISVCRGSLVNASKMFPTLNATRKLMVRRLRVLIRRADGCENLHVRHFQMNLEAWGKFAGPKPIHQKILQVKVVHASAVVWV